jgi:hypothetical protein
MNNEQNPTVENHLEIESPTPSIEEAVAEAMDKKVVEMPGPTEAPKIEVSEPKVPRAPAQQKNIPVDLQLEAIGKRICKLKGHTIQALSLRQTQMFEKTPLPTDSTIVICIVCGSSLAQIRG